MHGQQYGLWGVNEAPNPKELVARQPQFFPVFCRVCDTLMHARPEQVGGKLICPDCGGKTVVVEPPKPKPKKSPLVPDGTEYQLDPSHIAPTRPELQFTPAAPGDKDTSKESEPIRQERTERPKVPLLPIIQGVAPMLLRSPVLTWFFWLSAVGMTMGGFMIVVVSINPVAAIPFFIGAGVSGILGLGAAAAICLSVLTESSEGNDRLYNPPGPIFLDWVGDVFYLITAATLAIAPWWLLCILLEKELAPEYQGLLVVVGWLFTFPLLLLSSLEHGSPLEPFSARIFGSVSKRPGHWFLFVAESVAIVVGTFAAITGLSSAPPAAGLLIIPLCVASSLLYFRVLGRFAWWLAESLATTKE